MDMSKQVLQRICIENKLYRTPSLNDKLYANFKGFRNLHGLGEYVNLKALFLEGNALEDLATMPRLEQLRCLYVQQNCLISMTGLENLPNLDTLNISGNRIQKLDHLAGCESLSTLICTDNLLKDLASIENLACCQGLHTLDLQSNKLDDPSILDVITALPDLRCLYLQGNPVVSKIKSYRKFLISKIPTLTYLDDRPVFEVERRCAEAWAVGGVEAERKARADYQAEQAAKDKRNFEYLQMLRNAGWEKKREKRGVAGKGDPDLDDLSDTEWEFKDDPPELLEARKRLAAFASNAGEEEPPELSAARRQLVQNGQGIQENSRTQGSAEEDYRVYLSSIQQNQADARKAAAAAGTAEEHAPEPDTHVQDQVEPVAESAAAPTPVAEESAEPVSEHVEVIAQSAECAAEAPAAAFQPEPLPAAEAVAVLPSEPAPVGVQEVDLTADPDIEVEPELVSAVDPDCNTFVTQTEQHDEDPLTLSSIQLYELD